MALIKSLLSYKATDRPDWNPIANCIEKLKAELKAEDETICVDSVVIGQEDVGQMILPNDPVTADMIG